MAKDATEGFFGGEARFEKRWRGKGTIVFVVGIGIILGLLLGFPTMIFLFTNKLMLYVFGAIALFILLGPRRK